MMTVGQLKIGDRFEKWDGAICHCNGVLDRRAARQSHCGVKGCQLDYDEHESMLTVFIAVPNNHDLSAVEGLNAYLMSIKELGESLGVQGFAFPLKRREVSNGSHVTRK